eukprot:3216744-Pyramimonas_sp.AAC.1
MDKLITDVRGFLKTHAPPIDNMFEEALTKNTNSGREYFGYGRLRLYFKQGTPGELLWEARTFLMNNIAVSMRPGSTGRQEM